MTGMAETPDPTGVRARSFGPVAASYDTFRPRYPDRLVDDVVAMLPGRRVLEIGAGTGNATGYGDEIELDMVTDLVTAIRR